MMDNAFRGLISTRCFSYIDRIVIFGETIKKYNENLEAVLERTKTLGLRLEPSNNTKDGVKPNPKKISAVQNFKQLKTVK